MDFTSQSFSRMYLIARAVASAPERVVTIGSPRRIASERIQDSLADPFFRIHWLTPFFFFPFFWLTPFFDKYSSFGRQNLTDGQLGFPEGELEGFIDAHHFAGGFHFRAEDRVDINFDGVFEEAVDQYGVILAGGEGCVDERLKLGFFVGNHHGASAENERRADHDGEADFFGVALDYFSLDS